MLFQAKYNPEKKKKPNQKDLGRVPNPAYCKTTQLQGALNARIISRDCLMKSVPQEFLDNLHSNKHISETQ